MDGTIIPSPFKNALFWPEPKEDRGKKSRKKEKIPSVVASKDSMEYHKKKDKEKNRTREIEKENN